MFNNTSRTVTSHYLFRMNNSGMKPNTKLIIALALASAASSATAAGYDSSKTAAYQGLGSIGQGISQIGQAAAGSLVTKADKFVDTAGNVYTVLRDAHGAATQFVMNAVGSVFDVTKMTGTFLIDAAWQYPKDLGNAMMDGFSELQSSLGQGVDAAATLGQFAVNMRPDLPPLNQMHKPSAWKNAASSTLGKWGTAFNDIEVQLQGAANPYEEKYCTPASFKPSTKRPSTVKMPGFYIEVGLGECTVDESKASVKNSTIECIKPYLKYAHEPGSYVHKFHSAPKFTSKSCKIEKKIGDSDEMTLYEFSDHGDINSMAGRVSDAFGTALAALTTGKQDMAADLRAFVDGLNIDGEALDDYVKAKAEELASVEASVVDQMKHVATQ